MPSFRGSSQPRDWTCISFISWIGKRVLYYLHHLGSPNPYFLKYASCMFLRENYLYFLHCKVYHNFKYNIERWIIRSEHELLLGKEAETKEVNFFQRKKHKRKEIINRNFPKNIFASKNILYQSLQNNVKTLNFKAKEGMVDSVLPASITPSVSFTFT